jgi:putative copper export protein
VIRIARQSLQRRLVLKLAMRLRTHAILKRHVMIEQITGLGVLLIVSVLGSLAPPAA